MSEPEKRELAVNERNSTVTRSALAKELGLGSGTVSRAIIALKGRDLLVRVGSNKTGHWQVKP